MVGSRAGSAAFTPAPVSPAFEARKVGACLPVACRGPAVVAAVREAARPKGTCLEGRVIDETVVSNHLPDLTFMCLKGKVGVGR